MKVTSVNNIVFKSAPVSTPDSIAPEIKQKTAINELHNITPEYSITVPVKYRQTSVDKLDNGLSVYSYKLSNGYKVTIVPMDGSPAVVKSYVNVGSMNETPDIKGISHFLEHMAFNGTNGLDGHEELKQGDSFKKIDKLGGWANASTNYAITDYVNSAPLLEEKDLETQIRVIAAMAEDLKLSENMIKKEKGPVSSEINMILDNPQTIAMDQTVRTLFGVKSSADELVGGSVKHIQNLTRDDVVDYYNKYYTPDNTNIVVTGDVDPEETIKLVAKNFTSKKVSKGEKYEEKLSPIDKTERKDIYSDKAVSAEIVLGFTGPKNDDTKGKVMIDLVTAYLTSHEAGLIPKLKKENVVPIISSEKISTKNNAPRFNFITLNTREENSEKVIKTIYDILSAKPNIDNESLERLKQRVKQDNNDIFEHSSAVNDCIGYSILDNDLDYITKYNKILDSISTGDLNNAVKKYFDINKAAVTVVHPKKELSDISFKGKKRTPINMNEVNEYELNNNYDVAFYNTKSNNINVSLKLFNTVPYTKKAGVIQVLNEIYKHGTEKMSSDEFDTFKEKNNIKLSASAGSGGISVLYCGDKNNLKEGLSAMKELLYTPDISEKNVHEAINSVKNKMHQTRITSSLLQDEFDRKMNPYEFTRKEIRENLDNITVEDVKELHTYLMKNSRGIVTSNVPISSESYVKKNVLKFASSLNEVEQNNYRPLEVYKDIKLPLVLKVENHKSQADISEVFRFKYDDTVKEKALAPIMNSILSNSSIGLFDVLREKENLAYSVRSDISSNGNQGKISLNILTTTDNKEINEQKYDNLQKSIDGFNRQIKALTDGEFTQEDLDIAKRSIKASLLNNEGNYLKILSVEDGLDSQHGIELRNKIYSEVDGITKDDVTAFARKVFSSKPVYSITATKDTLNANKEYLENLAKA